MLTEIRKHRIILKYSLISFFIFLLVIVVLYFYGSYQMEQEYKSANNAYNEKNYTEAQEKFEALKGYKESEKYYEDIQCILAIQEIEKRYEEVEKSSSSSLEKINQYNEALVKLDEIENLGYNDSYSELEIKRINREIKYSIGILYYEEGDYSDASEYFHDTIGYEDTDFYLAQITVIDYPSAQQTLYEKALQLYNEKNFVEASRILMSLGSYGDSEEVNNDCLKEIEVRKRAITLSAGIRSSLAVDNMGNVKTTIPIDSIKEGILSWRNIISAVNHGEIVIGITDDRKAVTVNSNRMLKIDTSDWNDLIQVDAGQQFVVGLADDGTVRCSGHNGDGQCDTDDWKDIIAVAAGWRHTAAIDKNGELFITGYHADSQHSEYEKEKELWKDVYVLSAAGGGDKGKGHTVGLKKDGSVVAIGDNQYGQCNVDLWTDIIAISAGDFHTVGLKSDGTVITTDSELQSFFDNNGWKNIVEISAGTGYTLALCEDGRVISDDGYNDDNKRLGTKDWTNIMVYDEWTNKIKDE